MPPEVLGDAERRKAFDRTRPQPARAASPTDLRRASRARSCCGQPDDALVEWLRRVYAPIDRMLGEVINPFPKQLKALSADPYDDELMEAFCSYLEASGRRMDKVKQLFQSLPTPASARGFGLSPYHCFPKWRTLWPNWSATPWATWIGISTMVARCCGEAKQRRKRLQDERRRLEIV